MQTIVTRVGNYKVTAFGFRNEAGQRDGSMNAYLTRPKWYPLTETWSDVVVMSGTRTGCLSVAMGLAMGAHQSDPNRHA